MISVSRRLVMQGLAGLLATAAARPAAAAAASPRKVLFVFANGGWDPLTVFAPMFGAPGVDSNDGGERATAGGIAYVDHPDRPSVRAFFDEWHARAAVINGIAVPSLSHDVCTRLVFTGISGEGRSDWPSTVGAARGDDFSLPNLVISGPSFPDANGVYTARTGTNGQLASLVDGSILTQGKQPDALPPAVRDVVGAHLRARAAAFAAGAAATDPAALYAASLARAEALSSAEEPLDFRSTADFYARGSLAIDALAQGVSRCVTLEADGSFDTHATNDALQSYQFELLFGGLSWLLSELAARPGVAGSLLDETAVVVLSEMGRTPLKNGGDGRDHWPYTSALLLGAGVRGDQVVSGFDDGYFGAGYDAATGAPGEAPLSTEHLGATLLALADVDPAEHLPAEIAPIAAVLS